MNTSSRRRRRKKWRPTQLDIVLLAVVALVMAGSVYTTQQVQTTPRAVTMHPSAAAGLSTPMEGTPIRRNALFIGDSYTAGAGAGGGMKGEACLTARAMRWRCSLDAQGGTGFLADGHTNSTSFGSVNDRLASTQEAYPNSDIILVDVGRDDGRTDRTGLELAAATYLKNLRVDYPQAALVLIVPYYMTSQAPPLGPEFTTFLLAQAALNHATVIDPFAEGWISPGLTGSLTGDDGVHPSAAGHAWIAAHLAAALRAARIGV